MKLDANNAATASNLKELIDLIPNGLSQPWPSNNSVNLTHYFATIDRYLARTQLRPEFIKLPGKPFAIARKYSDLYKAALKYIRTGNWPEIHQDIRHDAALAHYIAEYPPMNDSERLILDTILSERKYSSWFKSREAHTIQPVELNEYSQTLYDKFRSR